MTDDELTPLQRAVRDSTYGNPDSVETTEQALRAAMSAILVFEGDHPPDRISRSADGGVAFVWEIGEGTYLLEFNNDGGVQGDYEADLEVARERCGSF